MNNTAVFLVSYTVVSAASVVWLGVELMRVERMLARRRKQKQKQKQKQTKVSPLPVARVVRR